MFCVVVAFRGSPPQEGAEFPALEVLQLDDNRLTSGVFWSIKNLKRCLCAYRNEFVFTKKTQQFSLFVLLFYRLKNLNLQGNCVSGIPYLLLRGRFQSFMGEVECGKFSIVVLVYIVSQNDSFFFVSSQFLRRETLLSVWGDSHRCCSLKLWLVRFCSSPSSSAVNLRLVTRDV